MLSTIRSVEASVSWARALTHNAQELAGTALMDPDSLRISQRVSRHHWLPTIILSLTACRFSELGQISMANIHDGKEIVIMQKKTKRPRTLFNLSPSYPAQFSSLDRQAKILHTNYDSLRHAIQAAVPIGIREQLQGSHDSTHVFRHLRASWLIANNWSIDDVSAFFAHQSISATAEYIHESLVERFTILINQ